MQLALRQPQRHRAKNRRQPYKAHGCGRRAEQPHPRSFAHPRPDQQPKRRQKAGGEKQLVGGGRYSREYQAGDLQRRAGQYAEGHAQGKPPLVDVVQLRANRLRGFAHGGLCAGSGRFRAAAQFRQLRLVLRHVVFKLRRDLRLQPFVVDPLNGLTCVALHTGTYLSTLFMPAEKYSHSSLFSRSFFRPLRVTW